MGRADTYHAGWKNLKVVLAPVELAGLLHSKSVLLARPW